MNLKNIIKALTISVFCLVIGLSQSAIAASELSEKQKDIVLISSYCAKGDLVNLEKSLNNGLDNGLTINEIKEILIQVYAYAGFPRSLNGISTFEKVLKARTETGIKDVEGGKAKSITSDIDKKEYGNNVQTELIGSPTKGSYIQFTPAIDTFLKEHLFCDIFSRGVLTYQEREIETVAILSSLEGLEPQLKGHLSIALHIGIKQDTLKEILKITKSKNGIKILNEITNGKITNQSIFSDEKIIVLKNDKIKTSDIAQINFSGNAKLAHILPADNPLNLSSGIVYFEKNAKTNWHIHPYGQLIIIKSGHGRVQQDGGKIIDVYAGDSVWFPPNVKHWHGASVDEAMSHYAFSAAGQGAVWFEKVKE